MGVDVFFMIGCFGFKPGVAKGQMLGAAYLRIHKDTAQCRFLFGFHQIFDGFDSAVFKLEDVLHFIIPLDGVFKPPLVSCPASNLQNTVLF